MSDAERSKDTAPFVVRCRGCQGELSCNYPWFSTRFQLSFIWCELADPIWTVLHTEPPRCCLPIMPETYCPGFSPYSAGGANSDVDRQVLRRVDHLWWSNMWPSDPHDECVWSTMPTTRVPRLRWIRSSYIETGHALPDTNWYYSIPSCNYSINCDTLFICSTEWRLRNRHQVPAI